MHHQMKIMAAGDRVKGEGTGIGEVFIVRLNRFLA